MPEEKRDGNERWCARPLQCFDPQTQRDRAVLRGDSGFRKRPAPAVQFPWAWLYSAGHAVLHLNDISQTDRQQRPDSGVIDHVAFSSRGFEAMKQHLIGKGVPYHMNQVPNSTRWQIFLRDPNNVEIELNFETKNETAARVSGVLVAPDFEC